MIAGMPPMAGFEWDDATNALHAALAGQETYAASAPGPQARARSPRGEAASGASALTLRGMREGAERTQAEIATAIGSEQGEISRIERREDVLLSTLRRYAQAIGAQCEVVFVFGDGGRRVTLLEPAK